MEHCAPSWPSKNKYSSGTFDALARHPSPPERQETSAFLGGKNWKKIISHTHWALPLRSCWISAYIRVVAAPRFILLLKLYGQFAEWKCVWKDDKWELTRVNYKTLYSYCFPSFLSCFFSGAWLWQVHLLRRARAEARTRLPPAYWCMCGGRRWSNRARISGSFVFGRFFPLEFHTVKRWLDHWWPPPPRKSSTLTQPATHVRRRQPSNSRCLTSHRSSCGIVWSHLTNGQPRVLTPVQWNRRQQTYEGWCHIVDAAFSAPNGEPFETQMSFVSPNWLPLEWSFAFSLLFVFFLVFYDGQSTNNIFFT